jgi:hypothetical protein
LFGIIRRSRHSVAGTRLGDEVREAIREVTFSLASELKSIVRTGVIRPGEQHRDDAMIAPQYLMGASECRAAMHTTDGACASRVQLNRSHRMTSLSYERDRA